MMRRKIILSAGTCGQSEWGIPHSDKNSAVYRAGPDLSHYPALRSVHPVRIRDGTDGDFLPQCGINRVRSNGIRDLREPLFKDPSIPFWRSDKPGSRPAGQAKGSLRAKDGTALAVLIRDSRNGKGQLFNSLAEQPSREGLFFHNLSPLSLKRKTSPVTADTGSRNGRFKKWNMPPPRGNISGNGNACTLAQRSLPLAGQRHCCPLRAPCD